MMSRTRKPLISRKISILADIDTHRHSAQWMRQIFVDLTRNNSQGECWNWCLCIQRNVCIKIREFINFQRTKQRLIPLVPMAEVMNENKVNLLVYFYSLLLLLSWLVKPYPTHAKVLLRWVFGKRLCPSILLSWAG